jgi:hypothetical protein
MQIDRRTFLAASAAGLAVATARSGWAAPGPAAARFVINVAGSPTGLAALSWGPLVTELQKRGFPTTIVPGIAPNSSFTDNETRAAGIVAALRDVTEPVVIVGISNEGGYLPLVAAARPVSRLVYVNACIPQPGKAFIEVASTEPFAVPDSLLDKLLKGAQPVTDEFMKLRADAGATAAQWQTFRDHVQASQYASSMKNFYEVCTLKAMPEVDNVDISGGADDQIRPAWEQATARRALNVEPVVIPGAGHADIVITYAAQVADAAIRGL